MSREWALIRLSPKGWRVKALVTGATGFIGSALVHELLKDGKEVRVLMRQSSNTKNMDGLNVERAYGYVRDKEAVKAALKRCDTFYRTAALYEYWGPSKKDYYDVNVEGTRVCLQAALAQGVPKIVHTSSIAALGVTAAVARLGKKIQADFYDQIDAATFTRLIWNSVA